MRKSGSWLAFGYKSWTTRTPSDAFWDGIVLSGMFHAIYHLAKHRKGLKG
jgi:hypothetical protein